MAGAGRNRLFRLPCSTTEFSGTEAFRLHTIRLWRRLRRRRSQKDRFTWKRIEKLAADFLPKPRILHPWPSDRFAVKHPRWEPYAGKPHVRLCAGGASLPRSTLRHASHMTEVYAMQQLGVLGRPRSSCLMRSLLIRCLVLVLSLLFQPLGLAPKGLLMRGIIEAAWRT